MHELAADMMREAQSVAEKLGMHLRAPTEKRIAGAENVGRHKTSMLQDVEAGRSVEIARSSAPWSRSAVTRTSKPHIDTV